MKGDCCAVCVSLHYKKCRNIPRFVCSRKCYHLWLSQRRRRVPKKLGSIEVPGNLNVEPNEIAKYFDNC
jgi:hypothetical protein